MLATTTIFYSNDWPKRLFAAVKIFLEKKNDDGSFYISKLSCHCIYNEKLSSENSTDANNEEKKSQKVYFDFLFKNLIILCD